MAITTIPCICETCGKEFQARPIDISRYAHHFCSATCAGISRRKVAESVCENCGNKFVSTPFKVKNGLARFCSRTCYDLFRTKEWVKFVCEQCGKEFKRRPIDIKRGGGRYCSNKCTGIARRTTINRTCQQCGKAFTTIRYHAEKGQAKYCSRECYSASLIKGKVDRTCEYCGKHFTAYPSKVKDGNARYCGKKCQHAAYSGSANPGWRGGHKNYRGENWPAQRRLARQRDGDTCQRCHRKRRKDEYRFHIHHIKPFAFFNGDYIAANDLSNLITLCPTCHHKAEFGNITVPKLLL